MKKTLSKQKDNVISNIQWKKWYKDRGEVDEEKIKPITIIGEIIYAIIGTGSILLFACFVNKNLK